jgi:hypothetical protein
VYCIIFELETPCGSTLVCLRTSHTLQECLVYFSERCCHAVVVVPTGDCKLACVEAAVVVAVQAHTCFIQKVYFLQRLSTAAVAPQDLFCAMPTIYSTLVHLEVDGIHTARRLSSYKRERESESNTATTSSWHICLFECTLSFKCTASCDPLYCCASSVALQLLSLA